MHDELTQNDIKKMEEEIEYRKLVVRKQALEDVKTARAQGDLSENFEYKAALQFFFTFFHKGGVICMSEVIDISPGNLDSSLCFVKPSVSHDVLCI